MNILKNYMILLVKEKMQPKKKGYQNYPICNVLGVSDFIHQATAGGSVWLFYDILGKTLGKGLVSGAIRNLYFGKDLMIKKKN